MYKIIFILSLVLAISSCKKNQENLMSKELSESIHIMSSDLNSLIFSHSLIDKFCSQKIDGIEDCFMYESDTVAGVITHTLNFEKQNFCDYYHDSTSGVIRVQFAGNYGSILDTISIQYENFKSNGHLFNGEIKAVYISNVNFTTSIQKILFSELNLSFNGLNYKLDGDFSTYFTQDNFKTTGNLSSYLFGEHVEIEILEDLEHEGNYTYLNAVFTPYFLKGKAKFILGKTNFETIYGINSQNYSDYSKAICIDSTGYRFILPLSKL
jgi:hypothetical protein